jgi:glycosyltransferase involved in cell wall biosynthesis
VKTLSVKTYGIYLAYPPQIDLRAQGLGRFLAEFLKVAEDRADARFLIACPSWMRKSLGKLFEEAEIPLTAFEIIGPENRPVFLNLYELYQANQRRKRAKSRFFQLYARVKSLCLRIVTGAERALVTTRSPLILILLMLLALTVFTIGAAAYLVRKLFVALIRRLGLRRLSDSMFVRFSNVASKMTIKPQDSAGTVRLYRFMEEAEVDLLRNLINARKDVSAWYSPTAFWPHFNQIDAPRLTCVPDVLFSEFPVAFSSLGGDRFLQTFKLVEAAIEGGDHFVTYSEYIKCRTLVDRYHLDPNAISVVPHGANRLDELITVSGFSDNGAVTSAFCANLFRGALHKAIGTPGAENFDSGDVQFVFYASQFRPNKNIILLLRAYEHLLKRRYIGHKLVLTGNPNNLPEIAQFITDHNLQSDVLCLHGLSAQELAACYRLADLAVNPSLSEGGCPFTLTEALSVGTPVVMARIPVTEEVVTDPELQDIMLFDPYDWKDIAARIEWALQNTDALLERQLQLYERLAQRSWRTVVDEHIAILDRISTPSAQLERRR